VQCRALNRSFSRGSRQDDRVIGKCADCDENVVDQDGFGTTNVHSHDFVGNDPDDLPSAIAPTALDSRTDRGEYLAGTDAASRSKLVLRPQEETVARSGESDVDAMIAIGKREPNGPDV